MFRADEKINWPYVFMFIGTPIAAIIGTTYVVATGQLYWQTFTLMMVFGALSALSITAGYHRYFSHLTYKSAWPVKLFYLLFGAQAVQGSVLEWSTDHRNHHRYTDTDKDPYNAHRGFWYCHLGWLLVLDPSKRDFSNVDDLKADKMVELQHNYYVPLLIFMSFVLPMLIAGFLWGDFLGGLLIAGLLRMVIVHHFTFCINSICHIFGNQEYSDQHTARDNWITALFTFGEGYHNYHHQFPKDYRNGIRYYHYDPSKWFIKTMSWIGLTKDLKKMPDATIIKYRLNTDEKECLSRLAGITKDLKQQQLEKLEQFKEKVSAQREHILEIVRKIDALSADKLKHSLDDIKRLKKELAQQLSHWQKLMMSNHQSMVMQGA